MSKSEDKEQVEVGTQAELTEWQQRNLEFIEKKEREKKEREKQRKEELAKRLAREQEEIEAALTPSEKRAILKREKRKKKQDQKRIKSQQKAQKKARRMPASQRFGVITVITLSSLILLWSIFLITPFATQKVIDVTGQQEADSNALLKATEIKTSDYIFTTILNSKQIEENVKKNSVWVKDARLTYQPFNHFLLTVEEYPVVAYQVKDGNYQAILSSGELSEQLASDQIDSTLALVDGLSQSQVSTLAKQLKKLSKEHLQQFQSISLTPTKATSDLLTILLRDGNTLKIPLSELAEKLPYYQKIQSSLMSPVVVDMEVGIYTTSEENSDTNITTSETSTASSSSQETIATEASQ
ncbi:cell division protein FtsQ/DivIB [Streptococcus sp. SGI.013]|uniref:cell division protein FtsQ/DivIB n=1 Tax=unclassified Streptococcus TaxID=2608887 RepID=UPI003CFD5EC0